MTRGLSPCFYLQSYEEYTNNATRIDVWAVFIDEWQYQPITSLSPAYHLAPAYDHEKHSGGV